MRGVAPRPQAPAATVATALAHARNGLRAAGVAQPGLDAGLLLGAALGVPRGALVAHPERALGGAAALAFRELVERRDRREPVSRILGRRAFWDHTFAVTPATFDPRPDSETLVEAALARIEDRSAALAIADLGVGTGCLLLSLLHELPNALGVGIDLSAEAAQTAAANARALGVAPRARFVVADWGAPLAARFDVIVTNPPYLSEAEVRALAPEVRFEPTLSLAGGRDGLAAYRALAPQLARLLAGSGHAVVEVAPHQAAPVRAILTAAGLVALGTYRDLAGRERCIIAGAPEISPSAQKMVGKRA